MKTASKPIPSLNAVSSRALIRFSLCLAALAFPAPPSACAAEKDPHAAAIVKRFIERPAEELYGLVGAPVTLIEPGKAAKQARLPGTEVKQ